MELNLTQSSLLFRKSIKRYLKVNAPEVKFFFGSESTDDLTEWCSVKIGDTVNGAVADTLITIHCCTRNDDEFMNLSRLSDKIIPLFSKDKVIPFIYQVDIGGGTMEWQKLMNIYIEYVNIGADIEGDSAIKMKVMSIRLIYQMKE